MTIIIGRILQLISFLVAVYPSKAFEAKRSSFSSGSEKEWLPLRNGAAEFQLADVSQSKHSAALRQAQHRLLNYEDQFADGMETAYDPYATAWRLLGFYVDCENSQGDRHRHRNLGENDGNNDYVQCTRYLLYAAYVDLGYSGGGIGEYEIYDTINEKWDSTACETHGNGRCVKMDCHLPSTNWKLLGFFKETDIGEWFGQLFKHEAYCMWSESNNEFMSSHQDWWPDGCEKTDVTDNSGNSLYYGLKPSRHGDMDIGLYTDSACSVLYSGDLSVEDVIDFDQKDDDTKDLSSLMSKWNAGLGVFKACTPCKAFNLNNKDGDERNRRRLDRNDDPNDGYFECNDKAGYTDVNQCMKFSKKTGGLSRATYQDVNLAQLQNTVQPSYAVDLQMSAGDRWAEWWFPLLSVSVFTVGILALSCALCLRRKVISSSATEPLMQKGKGIMT